MTKADLEQIISIEFKKRGIAEPGLEARYLVRELLVDSEAVSDELILRAQSWVAERAKGVPLAYLSGRKGFYKSEFSVRPGVLVPRPETEHVVEVALLRAKSAQNIADLGCGSGCIGLSLLGEWTQARLQAVDQSPIACEVTRENALKLGLSARVEVSCEDVEKFAGARVDLVVANPPYIAEGDPEVQASVRAFEPSAALYSGQDGLNALRIWSAWAFRHLRPGGIFVCEIGARQSAAVRDIMEKLGFVEIQVSKDLAGHDRVVSGCRRGE